MVLTIAAGQLGVVGGRRSVWNVVRHRQLFFLEMTPGSFLVVGGVAHANVDAKLWLARSDDTAKHDDT